MTLRLKANLVYAAVMSIAVLLGLLIARAASNQISLATATREASLMTAEADVAARYTREDVAPLIVSNDRSGVLFVPQGMPFYAVETQARLLADIKPGFGLRRVMLDPTSAVDRPTPLERVTIERLRGSPDHAPFVERHGHTLDLVTPLRMVNGVCATCFTSRAAAPPGLLDAFGFHAGFNRKPGEIVGITIASVPLAIEPAFGDRDILLWLIAVAATLWGALNLILEYVVLRPIGRVAAIAERVSLGQPGVDEFAASGGGEIGILTRSFNRLRRSMESALALIES